MVGICNYNENKGYVGNSFCKLKIIIFHCLKGHLQCIRIIFHSNVNYAVCLFTNLLCAYITSITHNSNRGFFFNKFFFQFPSVNILFLISPQACERAIDLENDYVTSEIDSSYPQCSKDSVLNTTCDVPQTTLYELLEYAKSRSILRNSMQNDNAKGVSNHHSHHSTQFTIRQNNSVQFNHHHHHHSTASDYSSTKTKKVPIRISSLKRESKTAQTLR